MSVVIVPIESCYPGQMPGDLGNFMSQSHWSAVCDCVNSSTANATCFACAAEWGCCCLTGFFCIFLCHPCIYKMIKDQQLQDKLHSLNYSLYGGKPVMSYSDSKIIINCGNINSVNTINTQPSMPVGSQPVGMNYAPQYAPQQPQPQYNPVVANAVYQPQQQAYPAYNQPVMVNATPVMAAPVIQQQSNMMNVTIPEGASGGSVMTVMAPNGTMISVTVPPNMKPGQEITVQY